MSVKIIVLFDTMCALFFWGISANETVCKTNEDCQPHAICANGFCNCSNNYIQYFQKCVPVKSFGEECFYDIQCNEPGMLCTNDDYDFQQKRFCFCDIYYMWNSTTRECLEISNTTHTSINFREVHNVSNLIERSAEKVFLGVVIAGLIFVSILLSFIGICSVYGCCTKYMKGRYVEDNLGKDQINEVAVIGLPTCTYEAIETNFSDMAIM